MNAPNLGTENPMTDKEILVERLGLARTAFRIAAMTIERDVRLHELTDDEEEMLLGAAIEAAAIASMPHSEQVEARFEVIRGAYEVGYNEGAEDALNFGEHPHPDAMREGRAAYMALTRNVSDKE